MKRPGRPRARANRIEDTVHRVHQAQEALFKAGAELYNWPGNSAHARSLFYASLAMVRLRQADPDDESPPLVAEVCRQLTEARPPGPPDWRAEVGL